MISRINYEGREGGRCRPLNPALRRLEEEEGDADSRDDGFILGLFENNQSTTQTTLDTL